ncbi:IS1595 family transposase [Brachyspira pilosicoli]|uniref:IS1595 family transposase n=1 Tax=Brachyspira pilosicoli TaxID=52584 RepID=UPI001CA492FE|nr:IS1595 family transposase [Brachyspira pilosicoli]MBW5382351.1 IS1595 family transposase [Brachyspira pilosicoli]
MKRSKLSKDKQLKLIEHFVAGTTARTSSALIGINRKTAILYYHHLRELIFEYEKEKEEEVFNGEIEVDESYFGGKRKGKRGGKVYVKMINNTKISTLIPIIRQKVQPDSIVYSDYYHSYDVLDVSEFRHFRINHSEKFAEEKNHINGIENFWNQAKRHLRKFNGIPKEHFYLFIKECQFRFNNPKVEKQLEIICNLAKKELF